MGIIGDFLRRLNPFDGIPASAWNATKNNVVGSMVYVYKGINYLIKTTSWADPIGAFLSPLSFSPGTVLNQAQIGHVLKVIASNSLTVENASGLDFVAGWVGARKVFFKYLPDYSRPDISINYLGELLGIPSDTLTRIVGYSVGRQGQKVWLNGTLILMTINHIGIKNYLYDIESALEFIANKVSNNILGNPTQADPNINPATGQPWGFGGVDLETGEVMQDGVIIKTIENTIKKVEPTPTTTKHNNLLIFGALALGVVIYKKRKKRKNR